MTRQTNSPLRFVLIAMMAAACSNIDNNVGPQWVYPVKLGMTKDSVHALAGLPQTPTFIAEVERAMPSLNPSGRQVEWYPASGIAVTYDESDIAREINFKGNYGHYDWIASTKPIIGVVRLSDSYDAFENALGTPAKVDTTTETYTSTWRVSGYAVFGEFWLTNHVEGSQRYEAGSLRWLRVRPALP